MTYKVKDISLAENGFKQIEWAASRMDALMSIKSEWKETKPLDGVRIGICLHVTKETANLVRTLKAGGADVAITGCNPLSTQDDVAAALAKEGFEVYAWRDETKDEYYENLNKVLDFNPQITIDDGCDLVNLIHTERQELLDTVIGGAEETTTGIIRLKAMEKDNALKYPMIAVNDNKTKHLLDNYLGTGQSTIDGILRATNILFAGKTVVVSGYGSCGKGVALRAKGLGSNVIVTEVDPFRALQAHYDGFRVMPMKEAAKIGDVFVTITGDKHIITLEHMSEMKPGAILANSGHFNVEVDVEGLEKNASSKQNVRNGMVKYILNGKPIYLLGEGRLVNLAVAEGHPSEVMDTSFCGQSLACKYLVDNQGKLDSKVIQLPEEIDNHIAKLRLDAYNVKIDELTEEQKKYLNTWKEGT